MSKPTSGEFTKTAGWMDWYTGPSKPKFQLPAGALEQLQAVGLLEQGDLPANGLWGEVQLLAGAGDAARLGHGPEVMQLAIVKHRRSSRFVKTEVYAMKIRIFLNYCRL